MPLTSFAGLLGLQVQRARRLAVAGFDGDAAHAQFLRRTLQLDMQQAAVKLVTEVPYDTAQSLFGGLTGMHFGSERMHTVTNQVGAGWTVVDVAPSRQEIERRIAAVAAHRFRRPVLVLGIDGAYVPTRPDSARQPCEGRRGTRAQRARWPRAVARRAGLSLLPD